ncbi:MAG: ImmA/IrrE family metallo-endopeptidase [Lachnospiraceae bacterium]|nr:ImmA/IrrE family metallo-endopeptidase [Lachnospiraceae bacterium]
MVKYKTNQKFIHKIVKSVKQLFVVKFKSKQKRIDEIAEVVKQLEKVVGDDCKKMNKEIEILENQGLESIDYMPTPFEIAEYYGIRCVFKQIKNRNELSYFSRESLTIFISDRYCEDDYKARHLCAHELGHFFLHHNRISAMNNYLSKTNEEYEANVFSILLMPQIMAGSQWEAMSPKKLNSIIYRKVFKNE